LPGSHNELLFLSSICKMGTGSSNSMIPYSHNFNITVSFPLAQEEGLVSDIFLFDKN